MNEQTDPTNLEYDPETEERDDAIIGRALRWSFVVIIAITAAALCFYLLKPSPIVEVTGSSASPPPAERATPDQLVIPTVKFVDITHEAGIDFVHENGAYGDKLLPETMGGGCAFFDVDSDGDQDLLLVNSQRWAWDKRPSTGTPATMRLYTNDGQGRLTDATAAWGLDVSFYGMGAAVGDYDNDGHVDLFISAVGRNRLFHNTGKRFEDVTAQAGVAGAVDSWSSSCGFCDYDNDGDLDLFVCTYVGWSKDFDLDQKFTLDGKTRAYGQPQKFPGTFPYLYRNDGNGRFSDVTEKAGVQVRNDSTQSPLAKSLGVTFADFNGDDQIDIVVANDTVQNFLFLNTGKGTFDECGRGSGFAFDPDGNARGAMGIHAGRFRNSEAIGIAVGNFANETTALYVSRPTGGDRIPQFRDEAIPAGISPLTRLELTFGVFFFDCDLDGRLDLFAANGHLEKDINVVQKSQFYEQPPQLLWNCGARQKDEWISPSTEKSGAGFTRPRVGRGAAYADLDGDGDLDILITATGSAPRLLRNDQQLGRHWVRFKLVGTSCNRDAIGAWVDVYPVTGPVKSRQVMPTCSYLSQVELPVTIGLDTIEKINKVVVRWPDGTTQTIHTPAIDRLHEITQAGKVTTETGRE